MNSKLIHACFEIKYLIEMFLFAYNLESIFYLIFCNKIIYKITNVPFQS